MEKKLQSLKAAYDSKNAARLVKAATAVRAYDLQHPMAVICNPGAAELVALAAKIAAHGEDAIAAAFK